MSTSIAGAHRGPNTRTVRKVEAPRPLKASLNEVKPKSALSSVSLASYSIESIEKLVTVLETVANAIVQSDESGIVTAETTSLLTSNIINLCNHLKTYGPQLENSLYQGQLDRAFLIFRDAMVRGSLEYLARVHLLEILELRERSWIPQTHSPAKNVQNPPLTTSLLPESDFSDMKSLPTHYSFTANEMPVNLVANEVIRRSGKHREKSSRIPSKNYCKEEIVIRNSDSGKVTPTAKERLVQITGPNEEKISYAEKLIEETIRNNSSPVRELFESDSSYSSEDSSPEHLGGEDYDVTHEHAPVSKSKSFSHMNNQPYQYKHKVIVRNCQLTITGDDYTYVTVAKAVLDDYFSKLRKSEWSAEDLAGGDAGKMKELLPNSTKSVSKIMISNSEPLDVNSAMLLSRTPVTSEPISLTETSDELSSPNTQPCEVDGVDLSIISDDVSVDPVPSFAKFNVDQESKTMYSKELLMKLRESELSREKPNNWELISQKFPNLVKSSENAENIIISD